jgi:Domain of unknown function (DUF4350)
MTSPPMTATSSPVLVETAATSTAAQFWRRWRTAVAIGLLVVVTGVGVAVVEGLSGNRDTLDPSAASHNGSRALAQLLRAQGVDVRRTVGIAATTSQARVGDTIVVIEPDALTVEQAQELRSTGANLVVVSVRVRAVLDALLPGASLGGAIPGATRDPGCTLPAAQSAGAATTGGETYTVPSGAGTVSQCYAAGPEDSAAPVVSVAAADGRTVTLLGSEATLRNDHLAKQGNAALTLDLLGQGPRLLWDMPSLDDAATAPKKTLTDLLPGWVLPTFLQLGIAVLLVAAWRARRLGPVVEEPLPVVVRAAEVTEGRARLYRRAKARDRASAELREATIRRLAPLLGIPGGARTADAATVASTVAERTGRDPMTVTALLYGGVPADDTALVALADNLDRIEREVRRS